jgi:hypothetical protein
LRKTSEGQKPAYNKPLDLSCGIYARRKFCGNLKVYCPSEFLCPLARMPDKPLNVGCKCESGKKILVHDKNRKKIKKVKNNGVKICIKD